MLVKDRVEGLSYPEIAVKHGLEVVQCYGMVRGFLEETTIDDEFEQRGIQMLRLDAIVKHLWSGLEAGSFKHAEAIVRAVNELGVLLDINKQALEEAKYRVSEEQGEIIYRVVEHLTGGLQRRISQLQLTSEQTKVMEEQWPSWNYEAATEAMEDVVYAEELE